MEADYLAAQVALDRARASGIALEATTEGLAFDAPPEALAELIDDLRTHKVAILELLVTRWPAWALEDTITPDDWDQRQESPATARLRKRAAELRTWKSTLPSTDGLPTNEPRPCDRCGSQDLTPTKYRLGTRWECFAPTCRIAGDRGRTWWLGRTIWLEGEEADT